MKWLQYWTHSVHSEHTLKTLWTHSEPTLNLLWTYPELLWTYSQHTLKICPRFDQISKTLINHSPTWIQEMLAHLKTILSVSSCLTFSTNFTLKTRTTEIHTRSIPCSLAEVKSKLRQEKQAEIYFCTAVFFVYFQGKEVEMSLKQVELTFAVLRASKQSLHKLEFRVAFFKRKSTLRDILEHTRKKIIEMKIGTILRKRKTANLHS